jgi:hypothetical protein
MSVGTPGARRLLAVSLVIGVASGSAGLAPLDAAHLDRLLDALEGELTRV